MGKPSDEFVRDHLPVYDGTKIIGKITSSIYSPRLKKNIGLAILNNDSINSNNLRLEYDGNSIDVKIAQLPFLRNK